MTPEPDRLPPGGVAVLTGCGLAVDVSGGVVEEGAADTCTGVDALEPAGKDSTVTVTGGDVSEVTVERVLRYSGDAPPEEAVTENGGTLVITAGDAARGPSGARRSGSTRAPLTGR